MLKYIIIAIILIYMIYHAGIYTFMIGNHYQRKRDLKKAFVFYEFACKHFRVDDYNKTLYAAMLLKDGQADQASKILNLILMNRHIKDKDKYYAKAILALIYYKNGDIDTAIELMENVMKNCINSFNYGNLGYLYIAKGDYNKALSFNLEAYQYNEEDTLILDNLADTYLHLNDLEKAKEIFDKLMKYNVNFPDAYYHYGQYLVRQNQKEEALKNFNQALNFNFSYISPISREQVQKEIDALNSAENPK